MGGVSLHGVASATNIESASWASTSSASNASYDFKTVTVASPSRPCCLRRHINGRSESPRRGERHVRRVRELSSTCSAANVSYYIQMPLSPPRLDRAACVATSMGGVSLHGVASATNIESASWAYTSSASNASYDFKIVNVASPSRPCCLRRHINGRSESPRRGERHVRRVRELSSTCSAANVSYYIQMLLSPPRLDRAACVATSMGGVSLHGVASATNIESASWASTCSAANVSYYIQMSPSPPRLDRAACVATSMGGVSLHGVASATNIESASWASTSSASNASYDFKIVNVASPSRPCCLRRHINGR
ncbi:hypothetical protein PF010_g30964, partial [Phytophthora fragariae]